LDEEPKQSAFVKINLKDDVIPGITAGIAGASIFEIPLTERDKNALTLFYTGQRKNGSFSDLQAVVEVLITNSPVLIYMGLHNLPELSNVLVRSGISPTMKIQILSRISQHEQHNYETNLEQVQEFLTAAKPQTPSIIVIGEYADSIT
jgi:siroheme synthase